MDTSTPTITQFDPTVIPFQIDVLKTLKHLDFSKGVYEILLSGSVGSAKTILLAHIAALYSLKYPGNKILIGRESMPTLKDTLFATILDHISTDVKIVPNYTRGSIEFENKSEIFCMSWGDANVTKVRSYNISSALLEELTESSQDQFYKEIRMRCGRLPHVPDSFIVGATNPSSPAHWAYKYFMKSKSEMRKVFYSLTEQNPFLPKSYIEGLKETLSPKEADRMLRGIWTEIDSERVYHNYEASRNFTQASYQFDYRYPVDVMHDFNIGHGKPMSSAVGQKIGKNYHIARTFLVSGARTEDIVGEMINSNILKPARKIRVFGDASGKHRDTRNKRSDYDIIQKMLEAEYKCEVEMLVPSANPALRDRHNMSNGLFYNDLKQVRMMIYGEAEDADAGFRLTQYKKGANLIEDDTLKEQHVTTAIGYMSHYLEKYDRIPESIEII